MTNIRDLVVKAARYDLGDAVDGQFEATVDGDRGFDDMNPHALHMIKVWLDRLDLSDEVLDQLDLASYVAGLDEYLSTKGQS